MLNIPERTFSHPEKPSSFSNLCLIIGLMLGSGIIHVPDLVFTHVHSPGMCLVLWLMGGIISYFGSLCFSEITAKFPKKTSEHDFIQSVFGHKLGSFIAFLVNYAMLILIRPGTIAAEAFFFVESLEYVFPNVTTKSEWMFKGIAIISILIVLFCHLVLHRKRQSLVVLDYLTIIKFIFILAIPISGLIYLFENLIGKIPHESNFSFKNTSKDLGSYTSAMFLIFFAYDGWHTLIYMMPLPKTHFQKTTSLGIILITLLYLFVNVAYFYTIPKEHDHLAFHFFLTCFGDFGKWMYITIVAFVTVSLNYTLHISTLTILNNMIKDHPKENSQVKVSPPQSNMQKRPAQTLTKIQIQSSQHRSNPSRHLHKGNHCQEKQKEKTKKPINKEKRIIIGLFVYYGMALIYVLIPSPHVFEILVEAIVYPSFLVFAICMFGLVKLRIKELKHQKNGNNKSSLKPEEIPEIVVIAKHYEKKLFKTYSSENNQNSSSELTESDKQTDVFQVPLILIVFVFLIALFMVIFPFLRHTISEDLSTEDPQEEMLVEEQHIPNIPPFVPPVAGILMILTGIPVWFISKRFLS